MRCPKCDKPLKAITIKGERWLGHTYSFAYAMSDKPMCDYSKKIVQRIAQSRRVK